MRINTTYQRFLLFALLLLPGMLSAQEVEMPATGSADTTMSYALVYDDGGPTGVYSSVCNATYTFHTVSSVGRYRVVINSSLTHPAGNACLYIYDGPDQTGYQMAVSPPIMGGTYYSNSNSVNLVFVADDDMPTAGFEVELCEYHNIIPTSVTTGFLDSNTIFISWMEMDTNTEWIFDYAIVWDSEFVSASQVFSNSDYSTIYADTCYYVFTDVPVGCRLVYRIYTEDTSSCMRYFTGSGQPYQIPVECPCFVPEGYTVDTVPGGIEVSWDANDSVEYWHVICMGVDTFIDGSVTSFFFPYDFPCSPPNIYINGNCTTYCRGFSTYLPSGGCHKTVGTIQRVSTTGSTIELQWAQTNDSSDIYLLYCRPTGTPVGNNVLVAALPNDSTSYVVTGLNSHTSYYFTIWVLCGGTDTACGPSTAIISTTLDNCIDFINLFDDENVHRTWGKYDNPEQITYIYGSDGRHVPILDSSLYDANTGGALRCVPPGEEVSLRLGDANVGAQAETITYDYEVDSLDKDMLVLRYAVVLQNPNHDSTNQPHFSMEIRDSSGVIIDTNCCHADFFAGSSLGWNTVEGSNVIWKDWSTVGIDIASYHGQRIKIRFITKDCADGGHYGYAYFTIHCDSKRIALVNLCDTEDSVRLRAPEGFEYQWTHGDDTTIISTLNEIFVPADSSEYHCHASFIGKPDCSFTINSTAVLPQPIADMHYEVDTCGKRLLLFNDCYVGIDSVYLPYVRQTIDSVVWNVDGAIFEGDTAIIMLDDNRYYHVKLSCKLSGSVCYNELVDSIYVGIYRKLTIEGDSEACQGDTIYLLATVTPEDADMITWTDGSHVPTFNCVVDSAISFYAVMDYFGCSDTVFQNIVIHPRYADTLCAAICGNQVFDSLDFYESLSGFYTHYAQSLYGCDSVSNLDLTVFATYEDTFFVALCDSSYFDNGFEQDSTGFYTHQYTSVHGCDSILHLDFVRNPVFRDTIVEEIYYGDIYIGQGFQENETGFYQHDYLDINGCDSIYYLDLHVCILQFPNAVTPNGDGYNDLFVIVNLLETTMFDHTALWIYDRRGNLIFHKENFKTMGDFWNPDRTNTPDGTYFYNFIARSLSHEIIHKGVIEVIR